MKPPEISVRCTFCVAVSAGDNPHDPRAQPAEHAAWQEAFQAVWREYHRTQEAGAGGLILRENLAVLPEQREFALLWRPFRHPFRLRVNDVIRVDERRGRVIRVTDCAAVVLINPRVREFTTRFDKPVRFQPRPKLVRIAANAETEVFNRSPRIPTQPKPRRDSATRKEFA